MVRGNQGGLFGAGRRGQDVEAAVVPGRVGPQELGLAKCGFVADDVGDRLPRSDVEVRRDLAELEVEIDDDDPIRLALGRRHRDVRGDR